MQDHPAPHVDDLAPKDLPGVAITPTGVSFAHADPETADARLFAMRADFLADFAEGRIGRHHNTFEHRSRVLRQLAEASRTQAHPA